MLEIIKTSEGEIKAVCEYYVVDINGNMDDKGLYCWVNDSYVSKSAQNNGILKSFVRIVIDKYPQLQFCYFWREKYKDKNNKWRLRLYTKRSWLKLLGGTNGTT